jgi:DNA-directed RNA polymerase specialized sigma24 family protein
MDELVGHLWSDDATAAKLVLLAQDHDELAGRLLLQSMSRRLAWYAGRSAKHELAEFVSAAWERIATYPAATRGTNVMINLCLDALKAVSRATAKGSREIAVDQPPEPPAPAAASFPHAAEIIDLAERRALVPRASIAVLRSVYDAGLSGQQAAELHGMSPEMVRYRCSAAIKKLRAHRQELLVAA